MGEMRLFAVGIYEVRDIFAAPPELAERLRSAAVPLFANTPKPKTGLLDKLGPLFRKPLLPPPGTPEPQQTDSEAILEGRFIPPDRVPAAWKLLEHWLSELSWGRFDLDITSGELDQWDFDLARAGMSSQYGIGKLFNEEVELPLRPLQGLATGYIKHHQVISAIAALELSAEQLSGQSAEWTEKLLSWLRGFPHWAEAATGIGRPAPDLVALLSR